MFIVFRPPLPLKNTFGVVERMDEHHIPLFFTSLTDDEGLKTFLVVVSDLGGLWSISTMPKCRTQGVLVFANFDDPPSFLGSVKSIAEQVHLLCGILYHRFRFPATFASTFHRRTCSVLTARFIQAIHLCKHHKTICQAEWTCHVYSIRSCSSSIRRTRT